MLRYAPKGGGRSNFATSDERGSPSTLAMTLFVPILTQRRVFLDEIEPIQSDNRSILPPPWLNHSQVRGMPGKVVSTTASTSPCCSSLSRGEWSSRLAGRRGPVSRWLGRAASSGAC